MTRPYRPETLDYIYLKHKQRMNQKDTVRHNWRKISEDEYHIYYQSDQIGETRVYKNLHNYIATQARQDGIRAALAEVEKHIKNKKEDHLKTRACSQCYVNGTLEEIKNTLQPHLK